MNNLRVLRKKCGITMKELGDRLGVSESAISHYETGKRQPDFETLLRLGEFFGVSVDYLLGLDAPPTVSKDDLKAAFLGGTEDLSDTERDELWDDAWEYYQYKLSQIRRRKSHE